MHRVVQRTQITLIVRDQKKGSKMQPVGKGQVHREMDLRCSRKKKHQWTPFNPPELMILWQLTFP